MFASIQGRFEVHQLFLLHQNSYPCHDSTRFHRVCYLDYDAFVPAKDGGQPRKLKAENLIVVEDRLDGRKQMS